MFKVIIIIFFNLTIVFSQNINELFDNGNEFYSQNNYKEAISNYEKILENGFFSEDLYLNLGNAYFHESNFGKARWSYEMGLKLNPINSDLKNNNNVNKAYICLLYTSDAADEGLGVDLGGRRIIKKHFKR